MKVKINSLPNGYSIVDGKVYRDGGSTTGDQSNYGLVQFPLLDDSSTMSSPFDSVNYTLDPVPRDEANLEAEKGETVLTDMNNDGDFELYEIPGQRHHKGGTPLNLPPQSFIYSDTSKMKLDKYELAEMNLDYKNKMTPAKISKNYQLNNFISLMDNEHSDKITKDTASYMLDKNKRSLSQLAFLQEAKKEFEDGVPLAAYPYLTEKGIDPIEFSQKIENISRQEAEQRMLMQLPIEERMQLLLAKEQAQQQAERQQQQNELIKQGQMPPSMMNQQAPNPNQDMAIQQQMSGQGMQGPQGMPPQGMPPQGMMPPQPPMGGQEQGMMPPPQQMQQPMQQPAMAKRGGQISLLNRKNGGRTYLPKAQSIGEILQTHQDLSVLDNPHKPIKNQRDKYSGEQLKVYDRYVKGRQEQLDWLNSPMAWEMILESVDGNKDEAKWLLDYQIDNLGDKADINVYYGSDEGRYADDPDGPPAAYSTHGGWFEEPYVGVYPSGYWQKGTPRHEYSHQSDQKPNYWDTWWHGWNYADKRLIPLNDVKYMEDNARSEEEYKENVWEGVQDDYDYYSRPTEVRARVNALRGIWDKEGIYDSHNEKLSKKEFDKIWENKFDYHPLQQLEYIYDKDEIFHMMNNFADREQLAQDEMPENMNTLMDHIPDSGMARYGRELQQAQFGLDLGGYFRGEQGWIPDIGGKSTTETWEDTSKKVQNVADVAAMTGIPGISHLGGYTSAAIDYGDAALAYSQGDYDAMKKELAKGTLTAGLTTIPGGNLVKTGIKGGSKALNLGKNATKLLTTTSKGFNPLTAKVGDLTKGVVKDLIKEPVKIGIDSIPSGNQNQVQANQVDQNQQLADSNQSQEEEVVVDQAIQSNQDAQITADQAANNIVADASTVDIMDTETPDIEETSRKEEEVITDTNDETSASIDTSATEEYTPQTQSNEEEYNPQSMAAWGYEIPKLQKGGYDAILDAEVRRKLNINDSNTSSPSTSSNSNDTTNLNIGSVPFIGPMNQVYGTSYNQSQIDDIMKYYETMLDDANSLYNDRMLEQIDAFKHSYKSPSMEQQMSMLGVTGAQLPNDDMIEVWENHIDAGGSPPDNPDVNYTQAYKNIHGEDSMPTYKNAEKNNNNNLVTNVTNVYNTPAQKAEDLKTTYINDQIMKGYQQNPYPTEGEDEQAQYSQYIPRGRQSEINFDDPNSPYYAGAQWTMRDGGSIPEFQKGGTITYNGREYTKKELKKIRKNNPAMYKQITNSVKGTQGKNIIDEINASRIDTEATEETTQYLTSGEQDWNTYYQGDSEDATQFRNDRYTNYKTVAEKNNLTPLSEEDFHKNYVKFQEQNRWMNENMSQEELSNPGWDRKHSYTPCADGESGCTKIDGKMWKKGDEKGANWQYNAAMENAGMDAFDQDMIKHMQAGFMGGKMMEMSEDERAKMEHSGVGDQTWEGFNISGADGIWGNTTNRQLEGTKQVTPGTEAAECTNAAEMEAACAEAGGNWTPYVAAVTEEDGTVTTPASGCQCDKPIDVPEQKMEEKDTPFWIQDEMAIGNALDDKLSLKKRYPWAPHYQQPQIDTVFKDPTREIAAIGEMAAQATDAATAFGGGAGRALAGALAAQGNAMKGISDAMNKVQGDNVTVANTMNTKNAEMEYKTQLLNNNEAKQLYDNTVLTDENYDNALRKANAKLTGAMQNAYTNRANTANLNSIYPQFDIDPASGGMIDITDPKAFYADPNYKDPQSHLDNYTETIDKLRTANVPKDQWPKYQMPNQTKGSSWAQQNQQAITSGGYQNQARRGREMRLAKKRMALRDFFGR